MFYITTNWWIRNLQKMVDDTVISVLPVPIGPDADDYAVNLKASNHTFGMLSTCKIPEEAGLVFQYWMENYPDDDKSQRDQWADAVFDSDSLDIIEMLSKCNITFDWSTPDTDKFKEVTLGQGGINRENSPGNLRGFGERRAPAPKLISFGLLRRQQESLMFKNMRKFNIKGIAAAFLAPPCVAASGCGGKGDKVQSGSKLSGLVIPEFSKINYKLKNTHFTVELCEKGGEWQSVTPYTVKVNNNARQNTEKDDTAKGISHGFVCNGQ